MARKLKHDNLPEIVVMNLHLSYPARGRRFNAIDLLSFVVRCDDGVVSTNNQIELQHRNALVLARMMVQRFITSQGWVPAKQIGEHNAAKYIYHLKSEIVKHTNSRLKIENNGDGYYRLGLEADALSFTITDLERCDDQQVIALVKMVAMKRPEAVNGICSAEAEPTEQKASTKEVEPSGRG